MSHTETLIIMAIAGRLLVVAVLQAAGKCLEQTLHRLILHIVLQVMLSAV